MAASKQDLVIRQGETFSRVVRWETEPLLSKPITGISQATPAVVTCTSHGVPNGWRVAVVSAKGMKQVNASEFPPIEADWHEATVLSANTVALSDVNSADWTAYTSGGALVYYTPQDITGYTARLTVKRKLGRTLLRTVAGGTSGTDRPAGSGADGSVAWESVTSGTVTDVWAPNTLFAPNAIINIEELASLTTENNGISIDSSGKTITLKISAEDTTAIDWKKGVYDLEMVSPLGVVTTLLYGSVTVTLEVTT